MTNKPQKYSLSERLYWWECELDIEPAAHPDEARRLDHIIESQIESETTLILQLHNKNVTIEKMGAANEKLREALDATQKRNKALETRWTQLRALLGISSKHEERWE